VSETALTSEDVAGIEHRVAALRERMRLDAGEAAVALRVVYAAVAAYAVVFALGAVLHYSAIETARFDLGNMVQTVWNTAHGHFLEATTLDGHQRIRLGSHVDPFLLVFVPLFWIWSSPLLLLVVQAFAVASGAFPVFWLARKHLGSPRAAAHFAFAYLLYPATQFNAFTVIGGFHSVSFAIPLVLYAVWFLDEDRTLPFLAVALLACTTKEEIPVAVGCLGIWCAVKKGRRLFGLGVFVTGLALTLFNFLWVIPHYAPDGSEPFAGRYRAVGGSPDGIAHKLFTDPVAFFHAIATGHKLAYLALLLVPFVGLWLFEPLLLLGAVPDMLINLLSSDGNQTTLQFQYTAGIVPFLVAASILGAARFRGQADKLSLWAMIGTGCLALYSPIYFGASDVRAVVSPLASAKAQALSLIPGRIPVSASNQLGGHLSERRYIYSFPVVRRSQWIVVDRNDPTYGDVRGYKRVIREYEANKGWRIVFSSQGVTVLHKRPRAVG
jgi:uncharacterized membrane protein